MRINFLSFIPLCLVIIIGVLFYQKALNDAVYKGLPTVSCVDQTKPVFERFTVNIKITIDGKDYPLDNNIGHDYGNCLRSMHTEDSSGNVFVELNDNERYTLGNFFQVWKKTFNKDQLFQYQAKDGRTIKVLVNGIQTNSFDNTIISPNDSIQIIYE